LVGESGAISALPFDFTARRNQLKNDSNPLQLAIVPTALTRERSSAMATTEHGGFNALALKDGFLLSHQKKLLRS